MKLSNLSLGKSARVISLSFSPKKLKRLEDLGLVENAIVKVVRFSPLNDLVLIKLRNFYLALRLLDASNIIVREYE